MSKVLYLLLTVSVLLSACTHPMWKKLDSASAPSNRFSELHCEPLYEERLNIHMIDEDSELFEFESGKSYLKAFELPKKNTPYYIDVNSYVKDEGFLYFFYPYVIFLNESYEPIKFMKRLGFGWSRRIHEATDLLFEGLPLYTFSERIQIANPEYKYLIVYTNPEEIKSSSWISYNYDGLAGLFAMTGMVKRSERVNHSPVGKISLSLQKEENFETYPVAGRGTNKGNQIEVLSPQEEGYHVLNESDDEQDYFLFRKLNRRGQFRSALVRSFQLGAVYKGHDGEKSLNLVEDFTKAMHSLDLIDPSYEVVDIEINNANCRRLDFAGKNRKIAFSELKGYDIICIHPHWSERLHPYIIWISTSFVSPELSDEKIPTELESFYLNVKFSDIMREENPSRK